MTKSEAINELAAALSKAQGEMKNAPTLSENPFYKSRYADLATVIDTAKPVLTKHGLSIVQTVGGNGAISVTTLLLHASGQWIESEVTFTPEKVDIQKAGAIITYLRRYSYASILGIASEEDDDGNAAVDKTPKKPEAPKPEAPKPDIEVARKATREHMEKHEPMLSIGKPEMFKADIAKAKTTEDLRAIYKAITDDAQEVLF
jgi:hypothetical protein